MYSVFLCKPLLKNFDLFTSTINLADCGVNIKNRHVPSQKAKSSFLSSFHVLHFLFISYILCTQTPSLDLTSDQIFKNYVKCVCHVHYFVWILLGGYKLSKLGNYHYLKLSCSTLSSGSVPNKQDQSKTEHEKSQMNNELDSEDEMFVCFGSLFSDEGDFTQVKKTNERSSRHQSHASESFSEMWLILRKSKSDVIDVFFHTRLIYTFLLFQSCFCSLL